MFVFASSSIHEKEVLDLRKRFQVAISSEEKMASDKIREMIPEVVLLSIRESYLRGIAIAERGYIHAQEDEDVVTGALGQALLSEDQIVFANGKVFVWRTTYDKFRGRGKNAAEKLLGADGVFQMEVRNVQTNESFRKGLLFQAKNNWSRKDKNLAKQAEMLTLAPEIGVVIDYAPEGYSACSATVAYEAGGDRRNVDPKEMKSLSTVMGYEFLECTTGIEDVFYDPSRKLLYLPFPFLPKKITYRHLISTKVISANIR